MHRPVAVYGAPVKCQSFWALWTWRRRHHRARGPWRQLLPAGALLLRPRIHSAFKNGRIYWLVGLPAQAGQALGFRSWASRARAMFCRAGWLLCARRRNSKSLGITNRAFNLSAGSKRCLYQPCRTSESREPRTCLPAPPPQLSCFELLLCLPQQPGKAGLNP